MNGKDLVVIDSHNASQLSTDRMMQTYFRGQDYRPRIDRQLILRFVWSMICRAHLTVWIRFQSIRQNFNWKFVETANELNFN